MGTITATSTPAPRLLSRLGQGLERAAAVFAFAVAMTARSQGDAHAMTDVMEAEFRRLKL